MCQLIMAVVVQSIMVKPLVSGQLQQICLCLKLFYLSMVPKQVESAVSRDSCSCNVLKITISMTDREHHLTSIVSHNLVHLQMIAFITVADTLIILGACLN